MKSGEIFISIAIFLILGFPFALAVHTVYMGGQLNTGSLFPRFSILFFFCIMAYLGKNWSRWVLGVLSVLASMGACATIALHFYTKQAGNPSLLLYFTALVYFLAAILLLVPKSVYAFYKNA